MESIYCLGSVCEFGLFAVFGIISLQLLPASSIPLGIDTRGMGIHQRQPSYLPTYNGIFSIHALNFTPSAVDKTDNNPDIPSNSSSSFPSDVPNDPPVPSEETAQVQQLTSGDEEVDTNELDSGDNNKVDKVESTVPQTQIITKTIEEPSSSSSSTSTTTTSRAPETTKSEATHSLTTFDETLKLLSSNGSETLLAGSEEGQVDAEPDIFDNLMRTIQGHWLDFVGKMKLSVLDVWKSISQHMMDRLENFAATL